MVLSHHFELLQQHLHTIIYYNLSPSNVLPKPRMNYLNKKINK